MNDKTRDAKQRDAKQHDAKDGAADAAEENRPVNTSANVAPGEDPFADSNRADPPKTERDEVTKQSIESFPASDPPSWPPEKI
jgi:hypothetical protein